MLGSIKRFVLDALSARGGARAFSEDDPEVAAAALMVHVVALDGAVTEAERARLEAALMRRHGLNAEDTAALVATARARERESVDLSEFTDIIRRQLGVNERREILAVLWDIAFADGELRELEDDTLWRIGQLLDLNPQEQESVRREVSARLAPAGR